MKTTIQHGDIHLHDVHTRMPFRYGIATLTQTPHAFVRVFVEVDGKPSHGVAADLLPPKWFTKDPNRSLDEEVAEMLVVIERALSHAAGLRGDCAFDVWRQLYDKQAGWGKEQGLPPLLSNFGTTLVERAVIEAVARATGRTFFQLLKSNQLGFRLGEVHAALKGKAPADLLPDKPLTEIIARHTVGLSDPLEDVDVPPAERLDDGLPQSLAASIREYDLRHFKLKVCGDIRRDVERLQRIAAVLEREAPADYAYSLDGNETFHSLEQFRSFWDEVVGSTSLTRFRTHLLFVEQPFHRSVALQPGVFSLLKPTPSWPDHPPMIIDESDAELTSLPQALALGYNGTSHKNCKGVFKGIANACLLAHLRQHPPLSPPSQGGERRALILSGEDLANIGPVALMQDLAVQAALGIRSVERNGQHYFAGLSMFPAVVQRQVLTAHHDLYRATGDGWPTLAIDNGAVALGSVNAAPFGVGFALDVGQFQTLASWRAGRQR